MNGIKMSDCRFYVNEAERTVVCVIPDTKEAFHDFIYANFRFRDTDLYMMLTTQFEDKLLLPSSFMGKAVCSVDDKWDEDLGRMIAFSRAKDKFYRSFFKRANLLVNTIDNQTNQMIDVFNTMGAKLDERKLALEHMIETHVSK